MLTLSSELAAHGRTTEEIAKSIQADHLVYLTLDGLKTACMDAAGKDCKVEDFEVGVFNGKYVTGVPEGYHENLCSQRQGAKRQASAFSSASGGRLESSGNAAMAVANSGPVYDVGPAYSEDIRSVGPDSCPRRYH